MPIQPPDPQSGTDATTLSYLGTAETRKRLNRKIQSCRNMGLLLSRYVPWQAIEKTPFNDDRGREAGKWSGQWLQEVADYFNVSSRQEEWSRLVTATHERWQATTEGQFRFRMTLQSRLIVGLGGKGALETGLTLHPITGLPIIPGSTLKGLCRAYALFTIAAKLGTPTELLEELDNDIPSGGSLGKYIRIQYENTAELDAYAQAFTEAFGSTSDSGKCIFFEAVVASLPKTGTLFEADVMTPHFRQYYESEGKKPPADNDEPNPITFMTVASGTQFAFAVGGQRGVSQAVVEQASQWLKSGLFELGIGAKTAAGYGVFSEDK